MTIELPTRLAQHGISRSSAIEMTSARQRRRKKVAFDDQPLHFEANEDTDCARRHDFKAIEAAHPVEVAQQPICKDIWVSWTDTSL